MKEKNSQHWASDPEKVEAFVLGRIDGRIDESERISLTAHLDQCDICRHIVQEERELVAGIRYAGRKEIKLRLKQWIQRGQGKRFDWTQAASLAAAIILMLSAVFTVRWFFDAEKEKTHVREIVLQESKPAERAMWIIGKVIEAKDKSGSLAHSRTSTAPMADKDLEFRDHDRSETEASQKLIAESNAERDEAKIFAAEESPAISSEDKNELHGAADSKTKEAPASTATNALKSRSDVSSSELKSAASMTKKMLDSRDSLDSEAKGNLTLAAEDQLGSRIGFGSSVNRGSAHKTDSQSELRTPALVKTKAVATIAKKALQDNQSSAILVRRGDMKDLPASMRNGDASFIHTQLERTPKGVLLTFYSDTITDSVATNIETIAPDSIIVTFRSQQIAYHIPGGWAGKM